MSTLNFDVFWRDRGAAKGLQNLNKEAEKTHGSFEKVSKTSAGFGSLTGLAFKAAGVAAVGYGLKVASANEQAKVSFTTMLGSAQKADVFLKQLQKFAATTPFEFPELQTAASSLISAGISANKVIPIMRTLGDVTAGMGTGAEGVKRATVAIQQMNAAGRITAEDLNQLRDAGIPVYDLLASATKKSKTELVAMAQAGKLGRKELEQLMTALESGKGLERFNGLMAEQSKTLAGMVSTLKDDFGQGLAAGLQGVFPILKASIGAWNDLGSGAKATLGIVAGSAVAFGTAAAGAVKLSGAFQTLGLAAKGARIATAGVGAALGLAVLAFGAYASSHAKATARVEDFTQALQGETEAVNASVRAVAAKQLQDTGALKAAEMLGLSLADVTDAALGQGNALARIQPLLDGYVAAGVDGSIADQDRATAAGKVSDAVKGVGGSYNKAVGEARQMTAATADGQAAMGGMEKKTKDAKEALQQWRAEMFKSARAALDLAGSEDAFEAAVDDATASVKSNGKTLDNNTEKGRSNRQALRNLASSSAAYREKLIEQGAKQKDVTAATERGRQKFIATAIKMGATRREAKELADKFGLLDRKIDSVDGQKVVIKFAASTSWKDSSGVKWSVNLSAPSSVGRKATGGPIHGPGSGTSDSIPTMLSNGEYVVNAKATARNRALLDDINGTRRMAGGGYLGLDMQRSGLKPANSVPGNAARLRDMYARGFGERIAADMAKQIGPAGSVGAYSANMAGTIAALRRAGARSFTTYPGHHPSQAKARDVTPHSWNIANTARASKSVWYVIYQMKIASKNHGNGWRPYHPDNRRGDWQHRRHVHVAWYDRGGILRSGGMAANTSGQPERVLSAQQTKSFDRLVSSMDRNGGAGSVTYIINATHYSDAQALKTALVNLNRQGALEVIKR